MISVWVSTSRSFCWSSFLQSIPNWWHVLCLEEPDPSVDKTESNTDPSKGKWPEKFKDKIGILFNSRSLSYYRRLSLICCEYIIQWQLLQTFKNFKMEMHNFRHLINHLERLFKVNLTSWPTRCSTRTIIRIKITFFTFPSSGQLGGELVIKYFQEEKHSTLHSIVLAFQNKLSSV